MDQYKNLIASKYGVTMAESSGTWSLTNIRTAYKALYMIDDKLYGHLRSMIPGTTFTIMGGGNKYYGQAKPNGVDFYVENSNTLIPETNFLHETGHLIDFVPPTANVFSGPITADRNNPSNNPGCTKNGYVNSELLLGKLIEPVQAINMGEAYDTDEYWADAFANYVADNILTGPLDVTGEGQKMYNYVFLALNPQLNP
jgi:hypothetical protein